jgi:hypothetical protein
MASSEVYKANYQLALLFQKKTSSSKEKGMLGSSTSSQLEIVLSML